MNLRNHQIFYKKVLTLTVFGTLEGLVGGIFVLIIDYVVSRNWAWSAYWQFVVVCVLGAFVTAIFNLCTEPGIFSGARRGAIGGIFVTFGIAITAAIRVNDFEIGLLYKFLGVLVTTLYYGWRYILYAGLTGAIGGFGVSYIRQRKSETKMKVQVNWKGALTAAIGSVIIMTSLDVFRGLENGMLWQQIWEGFPGTIATMVAVGTIGAIIGRFPPRQEQNEISNEE